MTQDSDRYIRIVDWTRRRYTRNGHYCTLCGGRLTRYSIIEILAARKYLGLGSNHPDADRPILDAPLGPTLEERKKVWVDRGRLLMPPEIRSER